jgi:oxygen-independent coproporphyrinogen-3 oxidase
MIANTYPEAVAVYVHTPFCPSKCGYCDFNSYAMSGDIMRRTTSATLAELRRSPWRGIPAKTVFFGGGTPTFLPLPQLLELLEAVQDAHPPLPGAEVTSEANPGTVDASKFSAMRKAGFNRISLGAQSFWEDDLLLLGRVHQAGHIESAVRSANDAGFENINVDLMFSLPNQTLRRWEHNLERALSLETEHLSLYGLTIELNTPFYKRQSKGDLQLPPEEDQVDMYDRALSMVTDKGFRQYEISNFALPGRECAHNLCYWRGEFYAAYGPGAVGYMPGEMGPRRYTNLKHPERYSSAAEEGLALYFEEETLSEANVRLEKLMLGLRLNTGLDSRVLSLQQSKVENLKRKGWINIVGEQIMLTPNGRHFCSEATLELM